VVVGPAVARVARRLRVRLPPAHEALRQQREALRQQREALRLLRVARRPRPVVVVAAADAAAVPHCR
jgi:hypothetical protein